LLEWLSWVLVLILFVSLIVTLARLRALRNVFQSELSRRVAEIQLQLEQQADAELEKERERLMRMFEQRFEEWKQKEMENAVKVELEKWRQEMEKEIRQDAIKGSVTTLLGKVGEQIAPLYMMKELGVSPRDLRFIGTPIDFIAFKGLSEGKPEKIIFIEVKASQSGSLTEKEKHVKSLVEAKQVEWITFNIRKEVEKAFEEAEKALAVEAKPVSEVEKSIEKPIKQVMELKEDEFYEWLVEEFQITREEYEKLDADVKELLKKEFEEMKEARLP